MNGKRAFVISSPYLVRALYWGKALFIKPRIKMWQRSPRQKHKSHKYKNKNLPGIYNNYSRALWSSIRDLSLCLVPGLVCWEGAATLKHKSEAKSWLSWAEGDTREDVMSWCYTGDVLAITQGFNGVCLCVCMCVQAWAAAPPPRGNAMTGAFGGLIPPLSRAKVSRLAGHQARSPPLPVLQLQTTF